MGPAVSVLVLYNGEICMGPSVSKLVLYDRGLCMGPAVIILVLYDGGFCPDVSIQGEDPELEKRVWHAITKKKWLHNFTLQNLSLLGKGIGVLVLYDGGLMIHHLSDICYVFGWDK